MCPCGGELIEWCSECTDWVCDDCGCRSVLHGSSEWNPTKGLWSKRNTPSGHFEAIKRGGDVTKGVRREN